ncbi:hypothetical protein C8J57DRAFT_1222893 [Mycena rebaudengoi]|nr:hypothetical protein C8J57DRAFT_1222893 [Mycena rebaudengoi]
MRLLPLYPTLPETVFLPIQCLCGWIAFAQTPDENGVTEHNKYSILTYREFLMLSTIFPAFATLQWIWLIYKSRRKARPSDSANVSSKWGRAGTHFGWILVMATHRIFSVNLTFLSPKRSDAFSALISSCAATSFRTTACIPLGILLLFPATEIFIFICAAYMIYRRSVAMHGHEKVQLPPQYMPAWMVGDITGLDLPPSAAMTETKEAKTV